MKKLFLLILLALPTLSYSDMYELNTEKESWYLSLGGKIEKEIISRMEGSINDYFNEPLYNIFMNSMENFFGKKFSESLAGMISIGPFIKIDSLIGSIGRSETQVMTSVILRAIDEAKEEIIMAVEQQFRDETSSRLNALISNYEIYNARSEADRQFLFYQLGDLIAEATYVRERISIKPVNYIDDIHPYLTVSSLQVMMQKEYTRWVSINNNPNITESEIEQEISSVMAVMLGQINDFFTQSTIGTLVYWENSFEAEFLSGYGKYIGIIDVSELDLDKYKANGSQRYAYSMGGEDIEFSVYLLRNECHYDFFDSGVYTMVRHFEVYDAAGEYVKKIYKDAGGYYINPDNAVCDPMVSVVGSEISRGVFADSRRNVFVPDVRDRHKNDVEAFNAYLVDGYLPVKRSLDEWWGLVSETASRPMSEVDLYLQSNIEFRHDLSVSLVSSEDVNPSKKTNVYRISNLGGGTANSVSLTLDALEYVADFSVRISGVNDQYGNTIPSSMCGAGPFVHLCLIGSIQPDEAVEVAVVIDRVSSNAELKLGVKAYSDGMEITARNNRIDDGVIF